MVALVAASSTAQDCSDDQQKAMQARFSACLNEHTTKHHMATGAGDLSEEERQVRGKYHATYEKSNGTYYEECLEIS